MTLVVPNVGEVAMLEAIVGLAATLKLFTNDQTPAAGDTDTDYDEASGFGYSDEALTSGSWVITPGAPSNGAYPMVVFSFTGALGNVYGYYVVDAMGGLLWAERFTDGPYLVAHDGDDIKVVPVFTLASVSGD